MSAFEKAYYSAIATMLTLLSGSVLFVACPSKTPMNCAEVRNTEHTLHVDGEDLHFTITTCIHPAEGRP